MLSQNYDVAAQIARSEVIETGVDLYRSSFSEPGEGTYIWKQRPQSLSDILSDNSLPVVVKLFQDNVVKDSETPVDLQRPLLLYKEVKGQKLHARNLKSRTAARDDRLVYQATGPFISIPDTYPGYFRPLEAREQPLQMVADVARVMPISFITTCECDGFSCISQIGESLYQKCELPAGVYRPKNLLEDTITYCNKRKTEKKKLVRCLRCEDWKGKEVLFPFEARAAFFVAEPNPKFGKMSTIDQSRRVYKWTELDLQAVRGQRIKLMHGQGPTEECQFTGALELSHVTTEHTVIGCTMTSSPRLFEMAVTSEPFFILALNSDDLESGTQQQKSAKFAKNEFDSYVRTIKMKKDYDIDQAE